MPGVTSARRFLGWVVIVTGFSLAATTRAELVTAGARQSVQTGRFKIPGPAGGSKKIDLRVFYPRASINRSPGSPAPSPASHPMLLVLHGFFIPMAAYDSMMYQLASRGYVVVGVDSQRGIGKMNTYLNDVGQAIDVLRDSARKTNSVLSQLIDPERGVGIIGHSWGGAIAVSAGATLPKKIKAVVGLAPCAELPQHCEMMPGVAGNLRDSLRDADNLNVPALFISGDNDALVEPKRNAEALYKRVPHGSKELKVIPRGSHSGFHRGFGVDKLVDRYAGPTDQEAQTVDLIHQFFSRHL